jgi:aminopeptidase-like protein
MSLRDLIADLDLEAAGAELYALVERLYPIPRSLTGNGVRETLAVLRETLPQLDVHEVATGTPVLDWTVPKEWNVNEAWIAGPDGERVVDWDEHNLHLLGYSTPVAGRFSRSELDEHLHSLPGKPSLIPYRTSYYAERWGFCLAHRVREALPAGNYTVTIEAALEDGSLTYGELLLPGREEREVLISTHVCHPSLCNDNLSGISVAWALALELSRLGREARRYSYRFLFIPGTIGSIAWLARNEEVTPRIAHGLVAANLGDPGGFHYKRTRRALDGRGAEIDRAVEVACRDMGLTLTVEDFVPFGYDERQYGSPGFDLPVGSLSRTPWGRYPQYHTSADDLSFVSGSALAESLRVYLEVFAVLEGNRRLRNLAPKGEPQLGRRGLYRTLGGDDAGRERELALLWVLNQSDGEHDLLEIAERSKASMERLEAAAETLEGAGLASGLAEPDKAT